MAAADPRRETRHFDLCPQQENSMSLERAVTAFAGVMILISLALTQLVSPWWWLLTAFVGLNLLQSSFTGFCPAAMVMRKLGVGRNVAAGCNYK
jgi:hypothetical protein